MDWVKIDRIRIVNAMPEGLRAAYDAWIVAHPEKLARVDGIVANLVMEFRTGIQANAENELDADTTTLPQSCVRHCETLCMFDLALEMGAAISGDELVAISKAEIFLRYMFSGRFFMTGGDVIVEPSPRYGAAWTRETRVLA